MSGRVIKPETPEVFAPLWTVKSRYKGAWGGRGSAKSNDRAQAVLIAMMQRPGCRVVCVREVQNSIKDSVKQLLTDWIDRLGLHGLFEVLEAEIRGPNKSLCIFRGMNDQNNDTIKSLEGYDIAWWEEAQTASERSLDLLRPTLRKAGSELWFTWNPRFKTDPIDIFLRQNPPSGAIVVKANWSDNPWFPAELEAERAHDAATQSPEKYEHVWLGGYEKAGDNQFIAAGLVDRAQDAVPYAHQHDETIMGVDVARFGDDETVIAFRRGRDAAYKPWLALPKLDTMETAARVALLIDQERPDAVFIDETGVGAGVVDRLRSLRYDVIGVNFGSKPSNLTKAKTANKRAEMWQRMKEWLEQGGVRIPKDRVLEVELTGVEYKHDHNNAIQLEKKEDMKKRGLKSPDRADALALTFAYPVAPRGGAADREELAHGRNESTGY